MHIDSRYQLKNIAGDFVVIATGSAVVDLTGSFTLNETGALLWKALETETDEDALVSALKKEYDVSEEQAREDVMAFLSVLQEKGMLV